MLVIRGDSVIVLCRFLANQWPGPSARRRGSHGIRPSPCVSFLSSTALRVTFVAPSFPAAHFAPSYSDFVELDHCRNPGVPVLAEPGLPALQCPRLP